VSFLHSARAVAWSLIGIRKNSGAHDDMGRVKPLHVIVVAFVAVAIFVGALIGLVHWVTN
jgi:hypothetical protein